MPNQFFHGIDDGALSGGQIVEGNVQPFARWSTEVGNRLQVLLVDCLVETEKLQASLSSMTFSSLC